MYKFVIATGGTGGHIFPALVLLNKLKRKGHKSLIVADNRFLNFKDQIPKDANYKIICTGSLVGNIFAKLLTLIKIILGIFQALLILYRYKPNMVLSFGGYISFPTMVAAVILRIPLLIHEQNSVIGKANRILLKWTDLISISFEKTKGLGKVNKDKVFVTGNPVKDEIIKIRNKAYPVIKPNKKIKILVLGGSQGARILSKVVPDAILALDDQLKKHIEIFQQCRKKDIRKVQDKYNKHEIKATTATFFNDVPQKLAVSNLVICRSGASTVSELIAAGRPAIFVPLAIAADHHQFFNAKAMSDKNAAWIIEEKEFNCFNLSRLLNKLLGEPKLLFKAATNIESLFIDSGNKLLHLIEKFCATTK
jgi:UDP-N-acetylglucosamine--N-acetylmuramyl-(pentapeptide) pyrophosphoryl-undecaprenol N-acetylglucosamine transferase